MGFPIMREAFVGWGTGVVMKIVRRGIQDFEPTVQQIINKTFKAVLEPIPPRKLLVKPEGQRSWKWFTMWSAQRLEDNDIVIDPEGLSYRVMSRSSWVRAGYSEYELTQTPNPDGSLPPQ